MNYELNWNNIKKELNKFTDVERLQTEVDKIKSEIKKFDVNTVLSESNQERLKQLEGKYANLMKSIHRAQRQFDLEFNKLLRRFKTTQAEAKKTLKNVRGLAEEQKVKFDKASNVIRKKVLAKAKTTAKKTGAKRKARKKKSTN